MLVDFDRRFFLGACAGSAYLLSRSPAAWAKESCLVRPDPNQLRSGDVLVMKKPGWPLLHNTNPNDITPSGTAVEDYESGRSEAVRRLREIDNLDEHQRNFLSMVARIPGYEAFQAIYFDGERNDAPRPHGAARNFVGHAAMIVRQPGEPPQVIEAVKPAVRVLPYERWKNESADYVIWHARVTSRNNGASLSADEAASVAEYATRFVGKPYELLFGSAALLNDVNGFYCSKLIWHAYFYKAGVALDDNGNVKRLDWVTPKMLLASRRMSFPDKGRYPGDPKDC